MIILHFHLQPQFKYELFHIYFTSSFVDKMMKGIPSSFISFICFNICTFAFLLPLGKVDISDFPQTQLGKPLISVYL